MNELVTYMSDPEALDEVAQARLRRMLKRYPWCSTVRLLLDRATRQRDPLVRLHYVGHPLPDILLEKPSEAHFTGGKTLSVIARFMSRPVEPKTLTEGEVTADWSADSVQEDPDLISEELAQIYLDQGLTEKAREIYAKLSLVYPEKSVYFAEIIDRIGSEPKTESVNI